MTANHDSTERHVTTDRSTIRDWADEADAVPVRMSGGGGMDVELVPTDERGADHERVDWDVLFEELEREDAVVAKHGAGRASSLEVLDREEAARHADVSTDELESSLMAGETVTTEVTETTVVEETIVEHADIESELIDRSTVSETILDAELVSRDLGECNVEGLADDREMHDAEMFEVGHATPEDFPVTVAADEVWAVTKEVVERAAIESRVVDRDVETSSEVTADAIESRIDLGDVERTIVDSGILESSSTDVDPVDEELFRSDFTEDDAIITEFVERKTVEGEVSVEREYVGTIDAAETRSVHQDDVRTLDVEMAEADEYDVGELDADAYDRAGTAGAAAGAAGGTAEAFTIDKTDQGKTVVDASGEEVGIVADVAAGTLYVDPHPSLTDKIRAKLDWGDMDEDSYPLAPDEIDEITRDHVRIRDQR